YLEPGVYDKIRKSRELTAKVLGAIEARPGVQRVFMSDEIRDGTKSKDPLVRAAALSYFQGRGGDIVYAAKPGWMIAGGGRTHGDVRRRRHARRQAARRARRRQHHERMRPPRRALPPRDRGRRTPRRLRRQRGAEAVAARRRRHPRVGLPRARARPGPVEVP